MKKVSHPAANLGFFFLLIVALVLIIFQPFSVKPVESSVNVSAEVGSNQINQLDGKLKEKQAQVSLKEQTLDKQIQSLNLTQRLLLAAWFFLFWLIILNFYFDYRRSLKIIKDTLRGRNL